MGASIKIGYGRVSSTRQRDEGQSLDDQEQRLLDYGCTEILAESQSGYSTKKSRAEFQKFINRGKELAAQGHQVELVVCYGDRFARNMILTISKVEELEASGIILHAFDYGNLSTATPAEWFKLVIMSATWEQFSRSLGDRISNVYKGKRSKGLAYGRPPYGWKWNEDKTFFVADTSGDPSPWDIARQEVDWGLDGHTARKISNLLWDDFGRKASREGIIKRLQSPVLYGSLRYPNFPEILEIPGVHQPICTYLEWQQIQKNIDQNKRHWGAHANQREWTQHAVTGAIVRCRHCEGTMNRSGRTNKTMPPTYYFFCRNRQCKAKGTCREDVIESLIQDALAARASDIALGVALVDEKPDTETIQLQQQLSQLQTMYEQFRTESLLEVMSEVKGKIDAAQARMRLSQLSPVNVDEGLRDAIADRGIWQHIDAVDRRQLYRELVKSVWVLDGKVDQVELLF